MDWTAPGFADRANRPELRNQMINDGPALIAEATEALIARLVRHGIPEVEARQRLQVTWIVPTAIPLPTLEELDAMPDGPVINDDEMEAWLEADAARLAAAWRK